MEEAVYVSAFIGRLQKELTIIQSISQEAQKPSTKVEAVDCSRSSHTSSKVEANQMLKHICSAGQLQDFSKAEASKQ
jgi:hypothetical protein